jgi:hypothetical protein
MILRMVLADAFAAKEPWFKPKSSASKMRMRASIDANPNSMPEHRSHARASSGASSHSSIPRPVHKAIDLTKLSAPVITLLRP